MAGRILQVVTDTDRRGAQVFASDLHVAMESTGRSVRTVALAPGRVGGLELPVLGAKRRGLGTLRALRREFGSADVVVAHGSTTLPTCAIASVGTGVPFVYRQISDSRFWASTGARRWRVRAALSRAARVVALWSGAARTVSELYGVPPERIKVVPNGVPVAPFGVPDDEQRRAARARFGVTAPGTIALSIGALVAEKGVDLALRAVAAVPGSVLLVVGDGPERQALEQLGRELAPGRVVFAGSIEDPAAAYAAADLVVLPSRGGDSMPAVLIEAGLCGLPVVATPVEGIPEVVVAGVTGEIVAVDRPDELTAAVAKLAGDATLRREMGDRGREHCLGRFAIGVVAERWLSVLDEVVDASG